MKVEYKRNSIQIIPENEKDEIYLESVCNTHKKGDKAVAERISAMGMESVWAYLEIKKG